MNSGKTKYLQSTKILLLPSKYEIIFVTLKNGNREKSNIAIAILKNELFRILIVAIIFLSTVLYYSKFML